MCKWPLGSTCVERHASKPKGLQTRVYTAYILASRGLCPISGELLLVTVIKCHSPSNASITFTYGGSFSAVGDVELVPALTGSGAAAAAAAATASTSNSSALTRHRC